MSIDIDKNKTHILQVYDDVLDDRSATDWALFGYEGQTNTLKVVGSGDDGIEELADELNASKIMYAVIRIQDPKTSRTKVILLNWQGEGAPNLRKGICSRHLSDVKRMLKGVHITLSARTEEDVDPDAILDAVSKATSTEYNFKDRSELPDKNVPVGTNYKRTNPQAEIDANRRNKFWEEQEAEEKVRKEQEIKKREEEQKRLERERMDRELRDSKHREELNKERNARIFADKKAEMSAIENTKRLAGSPVWKKEEESNRREEEEVERSRRADMMRMERKKEAESLIGHKTHQTRSIFETQSHTLSHPIAKNEQHHVDSSRSVSRKLKEFNPSNTLSHPVAKSEQHHVDSSRNVSRKLKEFTPSNMDMSTSYQKENSGPKKSLGSRWPPPSEDSEPEQRKTVPGKITEWKPQEIVNLNQNENHQINSFQVVEQQQQHQHHQAPSSMTDMSSRGRNTFKNNTSQHHQSAVEPSTTDYTQPYPSAYSSTSAHIQSHTSVTSTSVASYSLAASLSSPIDTSPSSPLSKSTPSPQSASIISGIDERSNGGEKFSPGSADSKIKDSSSSSSYRTNGNASRYEEKEETDPYREEEEDEFGPVSMTYEVDGIEYQILTEHGICARALYDYQAADETEITFDPGDIITNIDQIDVGWWQGVSPMGVFGLFPANYVELINGTKVH